MEFFFRAPKETWTEYNVFCLISSSLISRHPPRLFASSFRSWNEECVYIYIFVSVHITYRSTINCTHKWNIFFQDSWNFVDVFQPNVIVQGTSGARSYRVDPIGRVSCENRDIYDQHCCYVSCYWDCLSSLLLYDLAIVSSRVPSLLACADDLVGRHTDT